jgi:hypothetical protein
MGVASSKGTKEIKGPAGRIKKTEGYRSSGSNAGSAFMGAALLSSGAGSGQPYGCSKDDDSFLCQSSRYVKIMQNIISFLLVIFGIYLLVKNRKTIF